MLLRCANIVFLTLLLWGCGRGSAPISNDAPPQRVISLAPNVTEIVYELGEGNRLVGRTDFCRWPPEAVEVESVGGYLNLDLEKVIALEPDLVIGLQYNEDQRSRLEPLGIDFLGVRSETISEILQSIRAIADALGVPEQGESLAAQMQSDIDDVSAGMAQLSRRRVLMLIGREPGTFQSLYAAGPDSLVSELVAHAGGVNVLDATMGAYPEISREIIVGVDPEVIIDTCLEGTELTEEIAQRELGLYEEHLGTVTAVREGRVILWTDPRLTVPGPGVPSQIEALARAIHPEAFAGGN